MPGAAWHNLKSRETWMLPYGKQTIDAHDVEAVLAAISSSMLTTGPAVSQFEARLAEATRSTSAVAVSSGTAALHAAFAAIGISEGDEVIVPAITFVATSNAVIYCGGTPVFADVDRDTLLVDPVDIESKITPRTKAIVAMDYAGQPCDYDRLRAISDKHNLILIADSCHSLGASFKSHPIGSVADLTCFSFHPVKAITTCEGGAITTNDSELAARMKRFRSHGIDNTHSQRTQAGTHQYDMLTLGCNYRISDLQCALGISQITKLPAFIDARENIARIYQKQFADIPFASLLSKKTSRTSANHIMVMKWDDQRSGVSRDEVFQYLRNQQIGVNVHYRPVYQHSWYQKRFGPNLTCPNSDAVYQQIITLPVFPLMKEIDVQRVTQTLRQFATSINHPAINQQTASLSAAG